MNYERYIPLLKGLLESISVEESAEKEQGGRWNACCETVKRELAVLKEAGEERNFYSFAKREYQEDGTYAALMKYLYSLTREETVWLEYMLLALETDIIPKADVFGRMAVYEQIKTFAFHEGVDVDFGMECEWNEELANGVKRILNANYSMIPLEKRNQDLIVIAAPPLLSMKHAPTKLVLTLAKIIVEQLKKNILVLSIVPKQVGREMCQVLEVDKIATVYRFRHMKLDSEYADMMQIEVERDNCEKQREVLDYIYSLRPLCIWNFGATNVYMNIFKEFTTYVYTHCTQGYAPVCADIFMNYIPTDKSEHLRRKQILTDKHVQFVETEFLFAYDKPGQNLRRCDYDMSETAFYLAVAGNRLDKELTEEFLEVIKRAQHVEHDIFIAIFGDVLEETEARVDEKLGGKEKVKFFGYADELIEYLPMIDLYIKLPGMGGGNSAAMAMSVGKPVITLDDSDVGAVAGADFIAETLEEFLPLILKYKNDKTFYQKQSKAAMERIEEMTTDDAEIARRLNQVITLIK